MLTAPAPEAATIIGADTPPGAIEKALFIVMVMLAARQPYAVLPDGQLGVLSRAGAAWGMRHLAENDFLDLEALRAFEAADDWPPIIERVAGAADAWLQAHGGRFAAGAVS